MQALRIVWQVALLVVIALVEVGVIAGLAVDTGPLEKVVLVAFGAALLLAAVRVSKSLGAIPHTH
jgi:hypothetical protein